MKGCSTSENRVPVRLGDLRTFPTRTDIVQNEWRAEKYSETIPSDQYFICTLDLHDKLVFKNREKKLTLGDCLKGCLHDWNYEEILRKKAEEEEKIRQRETELLAFSKEGSHCFPKTKVSYSRGKRFTPRCEDCERLHQKEMAILAQQKEEEKEKKRQREEAFKRITRLSPRKAFIQDLDNRYMTAKKTWQDSFRECRDSLEKFEAAQQAEMDRHENQMQKFAVEQAKRESVKSNQTNALEGFFKPSGQTSDAIKMVVSSKFYRHYASAVKHYPPPGRPRLC